MELHYIKGDFKSAIKQVSKLSICICLLCQYMLLKVIENYNISSRCTSSPHHPHGIVLLPCNDIQITTTKEGLQCKIGFQKKRKKERKEVTTHLFLVSSFNYSCFIVHFVAAISFNFSPIPLLSSHNHEVANTFTSNS